MSPYPEIIINCAPTCFLFHHYLLCVFKLFSSHSAFLKRGIIVGTIVCNTPGAVQYGFHFTENCMMPIIIPGLLI